MSVVLDANVLVALLIADEHQTTVRSHVEEWLDVGEELHAPAALPYEVTNVLARLVFLPGPTVRANAVDARCCPRRKRSGFPCCE